MTPAGRLLIWRAAALELGAAAEPGMLAEIGGRIAIATGKGVLCPVTVQPESRKAMTWEEFLRGARLGPGARLTEVAA